MSFFSSTRSLDKLSEEELKERYRNSHDKRYIVLLIEPYTPLIYCIGMKYLQKENLSHQVVNHIYKQLSQALQSQNIPHLPPWLYHTSLNHCRTLLKEYEDELTPQSQNPPSLTADNEMEFLMQDYIQLNDQQLNQIDQSIKELPEEQRKFLKAFYKQKKSFRELTDDSAYNLQQVKTLLQNAKQAVKNHLTQPDNEGA